MGASYVRQESIAYRRRMVERWGFACVVCGRAFANLACVTKEHLVPKLERKRKGRKRQRPEHIPVDDGASIAPSHWRCNMVRHTMSIIKAAKVIERKRREMTSLDFEEWLNAVPPHQVLPSSAFLPLHQLASFELPIHLPGMR